MPALIIVLALWLCHMFGCNKTESGPVHTGRLEIIGLCGTYTVRVLDNSLDTSRVQANWTNPLTNVSYSNVFRVGNPCEFPSGLQEGDTLFFRIISNPQGGCVQCLAYSPSPEKALNVQVLTP